MEMTQYHSRNETYLMEGGSRRWTTTGPFHLPNFTHMQLLLKANSFLLFVVVVLLRDFRGIRHLIGVDRRQALLVQEALFSAGIIHCCFGCCCCYSGK